MSEACQGTADLLRRVTDDQLTAATPCGDADLGALIAHIGGLSRAFEAAARKRFGELTDTAAELGGGPEVGWQNSYPAALAHLADAWRERSAWEGLTRAGGVDLPAEVHGLVALTEVVVHGWDVAVSAGLPYQVDAATLQVVHDHLAAFAGGQPIEGLFDAAFDVRDDAPLLDRVVALSGRDPAWATRGQ